jgi:hypothetical protein
MTNRNELIFQLEEASRAIQGLIGRVSTGVYDESAAREGLACEFEHILSHLCLAWHRRGLSNAQIDALRDVTYKNMSGDIPNWTGCFRLVATDAWDNAIETK